jgi:hypothetical protein
MAENNFPVDLTNAVASDRFVEFKVNEMVTFMKESITKKGIVYEKKDNAVKQSLQHQLLDIIDRYEKEMTTLEQQYEQTGDISSMADIDAKYKRQLEDKINALIKENYVPVTEEVRKQREKQWLANTKRRKEEFLRTPEGKEAAQKKRETDKKQAEIRKNAKISIIGKIHRGENYSNQLDDLNDRISKLEPSIRRRIEKEEKRLSRAGDLQKQKVSQRFDNERAGFIEIFERRDKTRNEDRIIAYHEERLKTIDEHEESALKVIDMKIEEWIIHMKEQYILHGRLPENTESFSNNSAELEAVNEEPVLEEPVLEEPVEPIEEPPEEPVEEYVSKESVNVKENMIKENMVKEPNYDKIYVQSIIHHKISVSFVNIGKNMPRYFKKFATRYIEGKCRKEGYIRPNSTQVVSYSTGLLNADNVLYDVVFSCDVCYPCEEMILKCKIVNITKIGIRGIISEHNNPIVLFISREHNANKNFEDYEEGQMINIKVLGHRFELNDEYISVIGEII